MAQKQPSMEKEYWPKQKQTTLLTQDAEKMETALFHQGVDNQQIRWNHSSTR